MKFIAPERLYWIAVLLLPAAAVCYAWWRRDRELRRLFANRESAAAALRLSLAGRIARTALIFIAMAAILVAAARPYWRSRRVVFSGQGRDVAVVFDVSKSMWARDVPPSRLEHAKFMLRQLVEKLRGDHISLIAFAGNAYPACPLTSDRAVLNEYIDELAPDLVQRGGTNLEKGLREALKTLNGAAGTQAIVVITDGDELSGDSSKVISELNRRKIPLVVIGVGDPKHPAVLPNEKGVPRRDWKNKVITSALNEPALKRLAAETNGAYVRSTVADTGADAAVKRIEELAPADHEKTERELPEERFDIFLIAAAAALLLALIVPERPWKGTAAALALCVLIPWSVGANEPEREEKNLEHRISEAPTAAALYNLGLERIKAEDISGAGRCFEAVLRHPDRNERVRAKALLNLGVMEHECARQTLEEAREQLKRQELAPALQKLDSAKKFLDTTGELYKQALADSGADALDQTAATDLRLLEKDTEETRKLKKSIEDLKEQLRKARQNARDAQKKNQQQQNKRQQDKQRDKQDQQGQQDRQQNKQQQDKQQDKQNQQGQQNRQQNQQGQQDQKQQQDKQNQQGQQDRQSRQERQDRQERPDPAQAAARQAAEASEKLREQAKRLGQRKLEERAQLAAGELRQAERESDPQKARPHLDRAVNALDDRGDPPPQPQQPKPPPRPKDEKKPEKDENKPQKPQAEEQKPANESEREQLLRIMNEEEREKRRQMRGGPHRSSPFTRDW